MTAKNRSELRKFLRLGARAELDNIPATDIKRQEDSVLRALRLLEEQPGVILADEVGMGKTYEALGIAAAFLERKPNARIAVITPGPDLTTKWSKEFARFDEMYDFGDSVSASRRLGEFVEALKKRGPTIAIAPITVFQTGKGRDDQVHLLELFFHWRKTIGKRIHGATATAIMARFRGGDCERMNIRDRNFLRRYGVDDIERHLKFAFTSGPGKPGRSLNDLYESEGVEGFGDGDATYRALYEARFRLTSRILPKIDLLIVDEAHKLKSSDSIRTRGLRTTFAAKFDKALFLTATPFQLDVRELKQIFGLFGLAKDAPEDHQAEINALLASVQQYQERYEQFQQSWSRIDHGIAAEFAQWYGSDPELVSSPPEQSLQFLAKHVTGLLKLKNEIIEPGFRKWMIRSIREDKRTYRSHLPQPIQAEGSNVLPFLLYERFIAEIFRRKERTHKAAAEINMVSSYAAASRGENIAGEGKGNVEIESYRRLLSDVLGDLSDGDQMHPKLQFNIDNVLAWADKGEKTLIFCSRIATLEVLRRQLDQRWDQHVLGRWQQIYPGLVEDDIFDHVDSDEKRRKGKHSLLQARFHRSQDALSLVLREHYLRTVIPIHSWAQDNLAEIVVLANAKLQTLRLEKTAATRRDYLVAKRCVEQAAVEIWSRKRPESSMEYSKAIASILHADYLPLGLDLEKDAHESNFTGDMAPTWPIDEDLARIVIGEKATIWEDATEKLHLLSHDLRVRLVEQLARYLTYRQVPFLADLLLSFQDSGQPVDTVNAASLSKHVHDFWNTEAGARWRQTIVRFVHYFVERAPSEQLSILDGPLRTGNFARHTIRGDSRENIREAFNTPLFPMVLIANEVMQEGIDLHKSCRRIVHHDLVWNPAQIEQRIGRIDRLGSRTAQMRQTEPDTTLDVMYSVIKGTIDERMYKTVKNREKWLEFLLGAKPSFSDYSLDELEPPPLPTGLSEALAIDLGPRTKARDGTVVTEQSAPPDAIEVSIASLFENEPEQWGLRGDPFLWRSMQKAFGTTAVPGSLNELRELLLSEFVKQTGHNLDTNLQEFVERFSHGGMSSGQISGEFWVKEALPLLCERFRVAKK